MVNSMNFNESNINEIIQIAKEAGDIILNIYNDDFNVFIKEDDSPLTEADILSSEFIVEKLSPYGYPVISEEHNDFSFEDRSKWSTYWLIDPIDGTKEFINKTDEFSVNIALIHNNTPILGVIYLPVFKTLYWGIKGLGSFKVEQEITKKINTRDFNPSNCIILTGRNSFFDRAKLFDYHLKTLGIKTELKEVGSSIKMCLIAEGNADIYVRLGPTSEWDTAAAQIILEMAGGSIIDLSNSLMPLSYNTKESFINPNFFALTNSFPKDFLSFDNY